MRLPIDEPESVCRWCGEAGQDHDDCESKRKYLAQSKGVVLRRPRGSNVPLKASQLPPVPDGWMWLRYLGWGEHLDCWFLVNKDDAYATEEVRSADEWHRMKLVAVANGFESCDECMKTKGKP